VPSAELVVSSAESPGSPSVLARSGYALDRPRWSRDGRRIYLVRQQCASCARVLVTVPVLHGRERRVELRALGDEQPSGGVTWGRDGSLAVAVADSEGDRTVAIARAGRIRGLHGLDDGNEPDWSPDGAKLAFAAEFDEIRRLVVERVATGRREVWAHGNYSEDQPAWSPDGTRLAFSRLAPSVTWNLCVAALSGGRVHCLTHTTANERDPAWSPDGRRIAFSSDRAGGAAGARAVHVMDADGRNVRRLTDPSFDSWGPAWSPDGAKLAFVRRPLAPPG